MPVYQPTIPTGTVNLDVDYQNIQNNFSQLNIAYGGDHVPYTDTSGLPPMGQTGMHTAIHLVPVSTVASNGPNNQPINGYTATSGFGQVLSAQINDGINIDEALYFLTGGNRLQQLTRNFVPVTNTNGATFLPGGLILNWGTATVNLKGTPTNISFTQAFSSSGNVFSITIGCINNSGNSPSENNVYVKTGTVTASQFTVTNSSSGTVTQIYWMAIGK